MSTDLKADSLSDEKVIEEVSPSMLELLQSIDNKLGRIVAIIDKIRIPSWLITK